MPLSSPLTITELQLLNDELLAALRSGVSLDLGLQDSSCHLSGRLSQLSQQLAGHLADGKSLPEALEHLTPPPPSVYRVLVAAGVRGNRLEAVLSRLNDFSRVLTDLRDTLRRAVIYPASILVLTYLLTCLTTRFCVPALRDFLQDLRVEPTLPVRFLYRMYDTFPYWATAIPLIALLVGLAGVVYDWSKSGTAGAVGLLRYVPGFSRLIQDADLSRFAYLLSIQSEYGLPLPESLRRCADSVAAPQLGAFCHNSARQIEQGQSLGQSLATTRSVPAFLKWVLSVPTSQQGLVASTRQAADLYRDRTILKAEWIARVIPMALTLVFGTTVVSLYSWAVISSLITVWNKVL